MNRTLFVLYKIMIFEKLPTHTIMLHDKRLRFSFLVSLIWYTNALLSRNTDIWSVAPKYYGQRLFMLSSNYFLFRNFFHNDPKSIVCYFIGLSVGLASNALFNYITSYQIGTNFHNQFYSKPFRTKIKSNSIKLIVFHIWYCFGNTQ